MKPSVLRSAPFLLLLRQSSALALLVATMACVDGPTSPTPRFPWCEGISLGTMTAVTNGSTWSAVRVVANSGAASAGGSVLQMTGSDCRYMLWIMIDPVDGLGSYSLEDGVTVLFNPDPGPNEWTANRFQGGSGSVTLTRFTPSALSAASVAGTFEFTLVRPGFLASMVIRGSFDIRASP